MKSFIVLLSAVVLTASAVEVKSTGSLKCVPARQFIHDHNTCRCNPEGTEITCEKGGSILKPELHYVQLQNLSIPCIPNQRFKEFGQDCVCDESGTRASCIRFRKKDIKDTKDKCLPGSVFSDSCNNCICGADGTAACTNLNCGLLYQDDNYDYIKCVPGADMIFYCNDCSCMYDGKSMFCDRMGCGTINIYHEHLINVTMSCEASSQFNYNCHQCFCEEKGNYAMCNGVECPKGFDESKITNTVDKCDPGTVFADKCNVCVCSKKGKGVCTTNSCDIKYELS